MSATTPADLRCPLCGSDRPRPVRLPDGPALAECRDCGFFFARRYCSKLGEKCTACLHPCSGGDRDAAANYASSSAGRRLVVDRARLARIERLQGPVKGRRVLEVGAGGGTLAGLLLDAGAAYDGLEPMPALYAQCRRSFPLAAARVKNAFLEAVPADAEGYDLAIAVDVLEYTAPPQEFLSRLAGLLREGGRIYLEVPDEQRFGLRTRVRRALRLYRGAVHSGHVNFFSQRALKAAAAKAGLDVLSCGRLTLLGDPARLEATLKRPVPLWLRAASAAARATRLDLALGMGNLYMLCGRR